ncbi:MAG TPA: sugar ABC transporter ATP-binding protein [Anaerolineae bacterium]|nr:sugar ABC transporter ATP-binding protein [Anaerolineae bacterium]
MSDIVLEMQHIHKSFPGVKAVDDVSIKVRSGQVVGLIGENGAGKSTLMKILVGLYAPDQGEILLRGTVITPRSVKDASRYGIGMVFQEQALLGNLTVAENIFLGNEEPYIRRGVISWKKLNGAAGNQLAAIGAKISPKIRTDRLDFSQRQMVELARVMALAGRSQQTPIIIFDEPTTVGSEEDIARLFETIHGLKDTGACIIFISHRLEEVVEISDYVYVMKDGQVAKGMPAADTNLGELHRLMVGRERDEEYYREAGQIDPVEEVVLELRGCGNGAFEDVSFELRRGEILGLCGVLGSGRDELCRALAGIIPITKGEIRVKGKLVTIDTPHKAKSLRIGYVPVDRRAEGLIQYFDVASNITLANPALATSRGMLNRQKEKGVAQEWIERLHIRTPNSQVMAMNLSGGNQQKVVLAKWLAAGVDVLILDHPTRGIDVGAKEEVYALIRELAKRGLAILLTSDALAETIALSNRILVMRDGEIQKVFEAPAGHKPEEYMIVECMC